MTPGIEARDAESPVRSRTDGSIGLEIDREVFSLDALLRASYKFTDRCHVFIHIHETRTDRWLIVIRGKTADEHDVSDIAGDFSNELIDQQLRERLERQFGDVRTLIVAQAFAEGNLLDAAGADEDYVEDPPGSDAHGREARFPSPGSFSADQQDQHLPAAAVSLHAVARRRSAAHE